MEDINSWQKKIELCPYSCRLINKLDLLNETSGNKVKVDILEVQKAIYYAKKYHGEQRRQSGEPYYSHPLEVAYMISSYLFRTDIIVTAILHDTLEDTELTALMISDIFNSQIAAQVEDLTRIKSTGKISSAELVEILWQQKKYDLLLIKQVDRLHNMLTIGAKSPDKIKKIAIETVANFIVLAAYLGIKDMEAQLTQICTSIFNSSPTPLDSPLPFGNDQHLFSLLFQNNTTHTCN